MNHHLFYAHSAPIVFVFTSIVLLATAVVGYFTGRRASQNGADQSQIGAIQSSVLGMLALLLGFTFGAASNRYDMRRILVVDEANAIGTTFMRAQTLPEPYRTNISKKLRDYVDLRLHSTARLDKLDELDKMSKKTGLLQQDLWEQADEVARKYPNDITGNFEESLNESIDLCSSRLAAFLARVPNSIMQILAIISIASLGIVGYGFGLAEQPRWLIMALISSVVALVIVMIVDLDRPEAGPTRVSQQSMVDMRNSLSGFEQKYR